MCNLKEFIKTLNHQMFNEFVDPLYAIDLLKALRPDVEWYIIKRRVTYRENGQFHDAYTNF